MVFLVSFKFLLVNQIFLMPRKHVYFDVARDVGRKISTSLLKKSRDMCIYYFSLKNEFL